MNPYIPPLILVIDLDSTLIFCDEDAITSSNAAQQCVNTFYRKDMYLFFDRIREAFRDGVFLVLWSTGENNYVRHLCMLLQISHYFDLILGRDEADESEKKYMVPKSPLYLMNHTSVSEWVRKKAEEGARKLPIFAIVDDKADENCSPDNAYDLVFLVDPITLNNISYSRDYHTYIASSVCTLDHVRNVLYNHVIYRNQPRIHVKTEQPKNRHAVFVVSKAMH